MGSILCSNIWVNALRNYADLRCMCLMSHLQSPRPISGNLQENTLFEKSVEPFTMGIFRNGCHFIKVIPWTIIYHQKLIFGKSTLKVSCHVMRYIRRSKLTLPVISDFKPIIYIYTFYFLKCVVQDMIYGMI